MYGEGGELINEAKIPVQELEGQRMLIFEGGLFTDTWFYTYACTPPHTYTHRGGYRGSASGA